MNPNRISSNFTTFLTLLHETRVEYLVVGGYAVRYHGYLRDTHDLDVWTATHPANAAKLLDICQTLGSGIVGLTSEHFQHENRIVSLEFPPLRVEILNPTAGRRPDVVARLDGVRADRIEILTMQSGITFEECYLHRVAGTMDGIPVNVISLAHLKQSKQASGRPGDLADVEHLP